MWQDDQFDSDFGEGWDGFEDWGDDYLMRHSPPMPSQELPMPGPTLPEIPVQLPDIPPI